MSKKSKNETKKDNSPVVVQREKVKESFEIREFPWTERQREVIDLMLNKETKIVFINGPAGSSKTLLAVFCGLKLLNEKKLSEIIYVRTVIESASKGMGYLPGECESKLKPFLIPLEDKMEELLHRADIQKLLNDNRLIGMPVNYLRGSTWHNKCIISDESQNFDYQELTTVITRLGKFSKLIIIGDALQSDLNGRSGFKKMMNLFNDEESKTNGIHCVELTKADIMRSEILRFIIEKLEKAK